MTKSASPYEHFTKFTDNCVEHIPPELRALDVWFPWALTTPGKPGDKPGKPALHLNGGNQSGNRAKYERGSFSVAFAAYNKLKNGRKIDTPYGVGFDLLPENGILCIDLDNCRNPDTETGNVEKWALDIIAALDSYTEISASQTGYHIFVYADIPKSQSKAMGNGGKVEFFKGEGGRYIAVTGLVEGESKPVKQRQEIVSRYYKEFFSDKPKTKTPAPSNPLAALTDDEVLAAAMKIEKLNQVFAGNLESVNNDASRADYYACCVLARLTLHNAEQVDRIIRGSKLMRPKWDELHGGATYGANTIAAAFAYVPEPVILRVGETWKSVNEIEEKFLPHATELGILQRAGQIVRPVRTAMFTENGGLTVPPNTLRVETVPTISLVENFERVMEFARLRKSGDKWEPRRVGCPARLAATYEARGMWGLEILSGPIAAPLVRRDGSMLIQPGYDKATGLWFHTSETWPSVPEHPTSEEVKTALAALRSPFREFPFVDEPSRAVHTAAIFSAIQRRVLKTAPLFAFSAPVWRTGKSMLAESVGAIATGVVPPATSVSHEPEEFRKVIMSVLLSAYGVVNLDNITKPLESAHLSSVLTQDYYTDRVLGTMNQPMVSTNVLWTATGNNLVFVGDLASRVLSCELNAEMENPGERRFEIEDLPSHIIKHRRELVVAALTILRGYEDAGRPRQNIKPFGGFEEWSARIREPLVWAGMADPYITRDRVSDEDPERQASYEALAALHIAFKGRDFKTSQIVERSNNNEEFRSAILGVAHDWKNSDLISSVRLATWLRTTKGKIIHGLKLVRVSGDSSHGTVWKVAGGSAASGMSQGVLTPESDF